MTDEPLFRELIAKIDQLKPEYPAWLSVKQCAEYLGLSESTIRKLVTSGDIPFRRLPTAEGGAIRFNRKQIDFWLLSGDIRPTARARATFEALL
ncbi:MAG: helix-turn-helix domain-containing protein [Candidatus Marinimicrobia bacterium]|jgi:excisionase family DNA binding protein|nr:helix-turn-helix domain-containing protein [Candidatus Neomarinimicrobiota bacterium]MCK9483842.1 helix-turn-helix domain-containing protein [Candidatus Neomarinimicrobiota bacterium]MCK9559293.1 helix-turn-helix domain-containing protein [Candidatus Neomarinimicrobiota bacterium]MDD5062388.1 helix-turn-helix domain-containing protein [Candidatus Neomarinimicrobiota bacterium]MDD5541408.1 helix-turn-helix domain-containing protein [Candidatus Neomarinimicrobiota bacterium]